MTELAEAKTRIVFVLPWKVFPNRIRQLQVFLGIDRCCTHDSDSIAPMFSSVESARRSHDARPVGQDLERERRAGLQLVGVELDDGAAGDVCRRQRRFAPSASSPDRRS